MLSSWEFPGGLVVRIPDFHCCGVGSIPGWGTEIPQAARRGQKKKKKQLSSSPSPVDSTSSYLMNVSLLSIPTATILVQGQDLLHLDHEKSPGQAHMQQTV